MGLDSLKQQIEKKFETFYKTNKTRKAFDELYQDVLGSVADYVCITRELWDEFPKEKDFTPTSNLGSFKPLGCLIAIYKWKEKVLGDSK